MILTAAVAALRFAVQLVGRRLAGIGTVRHVMGRHTARTQLAELHRHGSAVNIGDLAGDRLAGAVRCFAAARGERQCQRRRTEKNESFCFSSKMASFVIVYPKCFRGAVVFRFPLGTRS